MKRSDSSIRKRIPIRRRFLTTVLLTTIISILAVSATGLISIRWIRAAARSTLTGQLRTNLTRIIQETGNAVDARLGQYERYISLITDSIEKLYADEKKAVLRGRMIDPPEDSTQYALTRAFASEDLTEEDLRDEILLLSNLEDLWELIARENEDLITTMYLGTREGLLVSYDRYSYLSVPPEGEELIYNYYYSEWYRRGMRENGAFYTGIYMDSQGRGLTITLGSVFRDQDGNPAGVACLDLDIAALYGELFDADTESSTFTFILDQNGTIIAPDSDTLDITEYTGLTLDQLDSLKADQDGLLEVSDAVYVCIPLERVGWTLCASVSKELVKSRFKQEDLMVLKAAGVFLVIVLLILLGAVSGVNRSVAEVIYPLELLRKDIRIISEGDLNYRASVYRNDEIGDITSGMNEMVDRLNFTLNELMSSQQHADAMSRLATLDTLTGIRNKTAFDSQVLLLEEKLSGGNTRFGFAVMDLNNLKVINDNYGHDKGDLAIKNLCRIICGVYSHSPVFRVGGDEFVAILEGEDYGNAPVLAQRFEEKVLEASGRKNAPAWDRVSAALGYALYTEGVDEGTAGVLSRADKQMYTNKKRMKGV